MAAFFASFFINLFDLGVFWYYLSTFQKQKKCYHIACICFMIILAAAWAWVNCAGNPFANLAALAAVLFLVSLLFKGNALQKIVEVSIFIGVGILVEPVGFVLLRSFKYHFSEIKTYQYYFVIVTGELLRCNLVYLVCRVSRLKNLRPSGLPKGVAGAVAVVFILAVVNCCLIVVLSLESGTWKSLVMCISIIISIMLTYYLILYMTERYTILMKKRHEDELYWEEMHYQEIYYGEVERRNDYVQTLKHDLKNRMAGLYHLLEEGTTDQIKEQLGQIYKELETVDDNHYSDNPVVDSVLRMKAGIAKKTGIRMESSVFIPKEMQMDTGDIGVLYGNLLDNALEACQKVKEENRYLRIENKYVDGKLILIIENSKDAEKNPELHTTKEDSYSHGRGISSVQKVVEKYNGTASFSDKGNSFEAAVMLYGIGIQEEKMADKEK